MKEPATERAVHTTPPMISAATIPELPLRPAAMSTTDAMMRVMRVMPLTGLEPTIAMALAATVVNRKLMTATMRSPTRACHTLLTTPPKAKKAKTSTRAITMPNTTFFMDMSSSVRRVEEDSAFPPLNSLTARPRADLMTPKLFTMPMIPAVAMPPIPMGRA